MIRAFIICTLFLGAQAGNIKIKPATGDKVGLQLKQKAMAEGQAEAESTSTATLAQTQAMLSQVFKPSLDSVARNAAARKYFRNVYHLPTTLQKMSAMEAFIQSSDAYQRSIGRDPGTVERLTPNELEHWLTTEFLPEDFRDAGVGVKFLYPRVKVPAGLVSRGPEFSSHLTQRTGCLSNFVKEGLGSKTVSFNYGTHCGATNSLGSLQGCDHVQKKVLKVVNEDREVCADHGTDACCARHDLIRTGININPLSTFSSCKANNALYNCMNNVAPSEAFFDKRGINEFEANSAAKCIYQVMPCLAQTKNRFYEINFKTRNVPHVRSMYPQWGDHHVQVVFPFDGSYGDDMTNSSSIYRKNMLADMDYSHWKHIDPPMDYFGTKPGTGIEPGIGNAMWDSIE